MSFKVIKSGSKESIDHIRLSISLTL